MHIVRSSQCAVKSESAISVRERSPYNCARLKGRMEVSKHLPKSHGDELLHSAGETSCQVWDPESSYDPAVIPSGLSNRKGLACGQWADNFSAKGCKDEATHQFQHPFLQAVGMFLGELSCLAVFYILVFRDRRSPEPTMAPSQPFKSIIFLGPAICDMTGTSIMYVALNMTSASSFQMLRGAVIIFTGLLSVAFLGRKLECSQWVGILVTIAGLVVVGLADLLSGHGSGKNLNDVITGDLLIIMAQIIVSIQMVLEEKFVYKHNVHPLRAVGTEGMFGFIILTILLIPFYYIPSGSFSSSERGVLEDSLDAFCQMGHQPLIILALLGNITSIAFFNFAGISVTKEISATTRMVLDSLRTVVIWIVSLAVGWEQFHALQILGFIVLLLGTCLYNGLHKPFMCARCKEQSEETQGLLNGEQTVINGDC